MKRRSRGVTGGNNSIAAAVLRALSMSAPAALLNIPAAPAYALESGTLSAAIPAQPLDQALEALASQTGVQFVYLTGVVRQQRSHAVPAGLGTAEVLARMLEGTGLTFEYLTPRSVHIIARVAPLREAATGNPATDAIPEVIVTANRREEYAQNVPITLQVMTSVALAKLNATTFDDFVTYLPGVIAHGVGPGQNNIYVRGLATGATDIKSAGAIGSFPNVSVYLDEQSAQLPNRNLDVYAADLERIEILEGPQGTLFGAGAEAGVMRYITNKPKLDLTEAKADVGYAMTAHGGQSNSATATFNIPLIVDKFAARFVIYNEQRGGYINNPPATFARAPTDASIVRFFDGNVPANSATLDNFRIAADHINTVSYVGLRAEALYRFNEDWDALMAFSSQHVHTEGVFTEMAANSRGESQPDLTVQLFNPSSLKDSFGNAALTINGRVGALKLLYAGSYLDRNVDQVQDYTQYSRGPVAAYYQCTNLGSATAAVQCFSPSATWRDIERNTHQSHELRVSTPSENRIRAIGGLFYENYRIEEQVDWFYLTALANFQPIGPPTGYYTFNGSPFLSNGTLVTSDSRGAVFVPSPVTSSNPNPRPPGDAFFDDITRGYVQRATYASVDVDVIPNTLTLTAGTRYSRTTSSEVGSAVGSSGCYLPADPAAPNPCLNHDFAYNIDAQHLSKTHSGFRSRVNLSWKPSGDMQFYYTWSQGFRAGSFNRAPASATGQSPLAANGQLWQTQADQHGGYVASVGFAPDSLTNNELGWKTRWLDRRIQWNGALYQENWSQTQTAVNGLGILGIIVNGGDYRARGVETSGVARIATGLTIEAGAIWSHSELLRQPTLLWRDGTPIDFSTLRDAQNKPVASPSGDLGSPLAGAPPFQGNIRVRYEFGIRSLDAFAQIGAVHQSHSLSTAFQLAPDLQGNSTIYDLPSFTTFSAALGIVKGAWRVQLHGENLSDVRAQLYASYGQLYKAITVSRPRTIGLSFSYAYEGH